MHFQKDPDTCGRGLTLVPHLQHKRACAPFPPLIKITLGMECNSRNDSSIRLTAKVENSFAKCL